MLATKFVPWLLTYQQKEKLLKSVKLLDWLNGNDSFLKNVITMMIHGVWLKCQNKLVVKPIINQQKHDKVTHMRS